jgi:multidrug efflux pump
VTLSDLSIKRPVLATVASLLIIVFGISAVIKLPIRELPDVDTPIIEVRTELTGASPEIVDTDITEIIEGAVAGISGIKTLTSESRRGRGRTIIEFNIGRKIDEAANDVRDAVGRVRSKLPEEIQEPRVIKNDSDSDPVMRLAVTSTRMDASDITDYVERYVIDRLATIDGVAQVETQGGRRYSVRIWLDRAAMAARGITVADVEAALRRNNMELPAGELKSTSRQLTLRLDSRVPRVDAFRSIVVTRIGGYPVMLSEVAQVVRGAREDNELVRSNGVQAIGMQVLRQSKANTMAISKAIRAEIEKMAPNLPEGMTIQVGSDEALFIEASIKSVIKVLIEALVLVVLVILLFLFSIRATLIPAVTIPVSLIGCMLVIWMLGYSVNVLTLLALLLSIGLVVDDAIIVLENVQRRIDLGESPLVASTLGTRQVTFAVIATSITLCAVFVPISFLDGQIGRLFTEFGFVMAGAVLLSTFVALSLCPMLASKLLKPNPKAAEHAHKSEMEMIGFAGRTYGWMLRGALNAPLVVITFSLIFAGGAYFVYLGLPKELSPTEDRGSIFIPLTGPQGSTLAYMDDISKKAEAVVTPLRKEGTVEMVYTMIGRGNRQERAFVVARLAHWDKRHEDHTKISQKLSRGVSQITGARGRPVLPSGLGLRGARTPVRLVVSGPEFNQVKEWAKQILEKVEDHPGLVNPEIDYEENLPQVTITVDRQRADDLGISVQTIASTLQTFFASKKVTDYTERGRAYDVMLQAREEDRRTPNDIAGIFVRSGDGKTLVPLTALVEMKEVAASPTLRRYNRLPSVQIEAGLAPGYDLGSVLDFMATAADEVLPPTSKIGYAGQSQQFKETSSGIFVTLVLAFVIVFLVLAAQFESFVHPLIIMLTVPLALAGAIYALWMGGLSINVYSQIGIILLVGLMAKNGILIVEFANQLRDEGKSVREAVVEASILRLRPIIMTTIATILGAVPLVLAHGAGAESRVAIGVVIVGGLGLSLILTLFLTPTLYDIMARFTRPRGAIEKALEDELSAAVARKAPAE